MNDGYNDDAYNNGYDDHGEGGGRHRYEVFGVRVPAGKRTYFFDVKATRSGEDYFLTITESKRVGESGYQKHKIYLYKEDFGKFVEGLHEALDHIREERLPDYDFDDVPRLSD